VVISSAVKNDNVEVKEARRLKIPVIPRAEMLAELMRMKYGIAVAGRTARRPPPRWWRKSSKRAGSTRRSSSAAVSTPSGRTLSSAWAILWWPKRTRATGPSSTSPLHRRPHEYRRRAPRPVPQHREIKNTFVNFANKVPFYCPIILCLDDPNLQSLIPGSSAG